MIRSLSEPWFTRSLTAVWCSRHRAMNGSRPFARFKAAVDILDLLQEWYAFKNQWYERKAEDWMHFHEVDFVDGKIVTKSNTVIWDGEDDEWGGEDDEWDDDDV